MCEEGLPHIIMLPRSAVSLAPFKTEPQMNKNKIILHLTRDNIAALSIIAALNVLGAIYLWKICTRKSCSCKLCRNGYRSLDLLGAGGYGSVYLVERLPKLQRFVAKRIPIKEITQVDEYSREAKELILLRHRHIVSYEEDFVHIEYALEPKTCAQSNLSLSYSLDLSGSSSGVQSHVAVGRPKAQLHLDHMMSYDVYILYDFYYILFISYYVMFKYV